MLAEQVSSNKTPDLGTRTRRTLEFARVFSTTIVYSAGCLAVRAAAITADKAKSGMAVASDVVKGPFRLMGANFETFAQEHDSFNTLGGYPGELNLDAPEQPIYASDSGIPVGHVPSESGDVQL